jgi:hypothetical protein
MNRLKDGSMTFAIALVILATGATLLAVRLGEGSAGDSLLAKWTTATQREGTYRFTMKQTVTGSDAPAGLGELFSLEGAIDAKTKLARTITSINVLGVDAKCTYVSKEPDTIFVNVHPSRRAEFGAEWLRSDTSNALAGVSFPLRPDQLDDDPERFFDALEKKGTAEVRGVRSTRYTGTFDLASLYPTDTGASPLPADVDSRIPVSLFIDEEGLVRRIELSVSSSKDVSIGFTIDFFDYGEPVALVEPTPGKVKEGRPEQIGTACFPRNLGARE